MAEEPVQVSMAAHPGSLTWQLLAMVWEQFRQETQVQQWPVRSRIAGREALVVVALCLAP